MESNKQNFSKLPVEENLNPHRNSSKDVNCGNGNQFPVFKMKSKPCQVCAGCKAIECKTCKNCLDKPKFGGSNVIKQRCALKVCEKLQEDKRLRESLQSKTSQKSGPKRPYSSKKIAPKVKRGKKNSSV